MISGKVLALGPLAEEEVLIEVFYPSDENIYFSDEVEIAVEEGEEENNGSFILKRKLDENAADTVVGEYRVKATYSPADISNSQTFLIEQVALSPSINVNTNKDEYDIGDEVLISGEVTGLEDYDEKLVSLRILNPSGDEYDSKEIELGEDDGSFQYRDGSIDGDIGLYTVKATIDETNAETTFQIGDGPMSISVNTDKDQYQVGDTLKISGEVTGVNFNEDLPVSIAFSDPNNQRLGPINISLQPNGQYADYMKMGDIPGEYTVTAVYDTLNNDRTFYLTTPVITPFPTFGLMATVAVLATVGIVGYKMYKQRHTRHLDVFTLHI